MSERVLEPLEMSDTEMMRFMFESCTAVEWLGWNGATPNGWQAKLLCGKLIRDTTLPGVIKLAAAYDKEMNDGF